MQQLATEERQDLESTAENNKIYMSEDADVLSCSEYQINPSGMVIDEDGSTQRIQRQELLDNEVVSPPGKLTYCLICGILLLFERYDLQNLIIFID